jgi:hypothetical protein
MKSMAKNSYVAMILPTQMLVLSLCQNIKKPANAGFLDKL